MKILLTGCAGFIGSHVLDRLLADGHHVIGVDNFDPFYSRSLKAVNLAPNMIRDAGFKMRDSGEGNSHFHLHSHSASKMREPGEKNLTSGLCSLPSKPGSFELIESDLADETTYTKIKFLAESLPRVSDISDPESCIPDPVEQPPLFDAIIHLAAKAGVRPSIEDPAGYQRANVIATQNLLEFAKENEIKQFVFASSSSVYGVNPRVPWREDDHVLQPISPYASTKVSCELMGHVYSKLYDIRFLGLRFFTVFGPRQRPDLAINKFVRLIEAGEPIPVFGDGSTRRDYTYIDDIVDGIIGALHYKKSLYEVVNLGNDHTVTLSEMISTIEEVIGKRAIVEELPQQPGDVPQTWADISKAKELFGYAPTTKFKEGVERFYDWWKSQPSL